MNKTITFEYNNVNYTLEYTRKTVSQIERMGFDYNMINTKPVTAITMLFRGAFLAHHSTIPVEQIDKILEEFDKSDLLSTLGDMYIETVNSLFEEKENNSKNSIKWKVS